MLVMVKINWYDLPHIYEMFCILEEGVMRASRLMRGFKTAIKMRRFQNKTHHKSYQVIFYHHLVTAISCDSQKHTTNEYGQASTLWQDCRKVTGVS